MKGPVIDPTPMKVFVAGPNTLQNELIASSLQKETGIPSFVVETLAQIEPSLKGAEKCICLALYDCLGKDAKACLADLEQNRGRQDLMLGLFNLERGEGLEKDAISCGARGFFYRSESFSVFLKGVLRIFEGELWISRQLLAEMIAQEISPSWTSLKHLLSEREKEVLSFMAGGATNREIADALFISPYTVKNHLQAIFRKINVHSKTQAALWANRHLGI